MGAKILTQERLKELLHYDSDTGIFRHNKSRYGVTKGMRAGSIDRYGYVCIILNGKRYAAHRLAWLYMTGKLPIEQLDHINRIRTDNRYKNLREVSAAENKQNLGLHLKNKSGIRGVSYDYTAEKWRANISVNGKSKNLGRYLTIEEAAKAYAKGAALYHTHNTSAK